MSRLLSRGGRSVRRFEASVQEVRTVANGLGCSFVAGTPVLAEGGQQPIEKLKPDDKVLARDEVTGEQSYQRVLQTFATPNDPLYDLELVSATGKREVLGVTGNHPFWVKDKGWTESDLLKAGMLVAGKDGSWLTVGKLVPRAERATGYNLEVEDDHTYFVGDTGVWVHNECLLVKGAKGGVGPVLKGQAGVSRAVGEIEAGGGTVLGREITLQAGTVRTRPDLLVRNADGSLLFVEVKNGAGATLTPNQTAGFPIIREGGSIPRGANAAAAGLEVGAPLPPIPVQVIRY
ncbi:polymorphic toxin-type HINT domain-containing protein [Anthocerotibacter panamensis]|uniref:polymorphic toxin-type HINT domain-containing protein n=1 Tax=Anthocerotibacter panamensis TaxID=2857077 RepID=UPI001C408792|nr:polymorphic toxin-type HINT domain-containing protein [Anthocerotibacter panamensis]